MNNAINIIATHTAASIKGPIRVLDYCRGIFLQLPSRKSVEKAFKKGLIYLNGEPVETGRFVKTGDVIALIESPSKIPKPFRLPLEVVYEDDHLAVVNKPAGYPVSGNRFKTIAQALPLNLVKSSAPDTLLAPLPVHRLDASTSGLLLVAKTRSAHTELGQQFERREVRKTYVAIVHGAVAHGGEIASPIDGAPAVTQYALRRMVPSIRWGKLSFLELRPITGRTHQLRIHLASLGHPILGDKRYGVASQMLMGKGLFLAAVGLRFIHPVSPERTTELSVPVPAKFDALLNREAARWERLSETDIW